MYMDSMSQMSFSERDIENLYDVASYPHVMTVDVTFEQPMDEEIGNARKRASRESLSANTVHAS